MISTEKNKSTPRRQRQKQKFTCDLCGYAGGDRRTEALVGGGFQGEEVGGSGVKADKQMMGLVPQLEHPSPLGRQVSTGIQGAQGLVCDLKTETGTFFIVFAVLFSLFLH